MHGKISLAVVCGFLIASTVVQSGAANADESGGVLETLRNVTTQSESATTKVLDDVAAVPTRNEGDSVVDASVQGAEIVIPMSLSDTIDLSVPGSDPGMKITLPFADEASPAEALSPGVVAFDNHNNTSTAAVVKDDGSLVIATVIESSDAAGNDIPTKYVVSGNELTQTVDLSSPNIVFPVVADPQAGYTLLEGVWKNRPGGYSYKNGAQWSTKLSVWGAAVWSSGLIGHQTVKTQGWVEWKMV